VSHGKENGDERAVGERERDNKAGGQERKRKESEGNKN